MLFNEEFLRQLSALRLVVKKMLWSGGGEEPLAQRGGRLEFNDYRNYTAGDETRYVDWNVFARTEKLFIKEFAREEELPVYLILDRSASVKAKWDYARRLTAALGYVTLIAGHRLRVLAISDQQTLTTPVFAREDQAFELFKFLETLSFSGKTDLSGSLSELSPHTERKGLFVLISDLFDTAASGESFLRFVERGLEVVIIHLLSKEEENPQLAGWLKLKDIETAQTLNLELDQNTLSHYQKEFTGFLEQWRNFCLKNNVRYFYITDNQSLEKLVIDLINNKILRPALNR